MELAKEAFVPSKRLTSVQEPSSAQIQSCLHQLEALQQLLDSSGYQQSLTQDGQPPSATLLPGGLAHAGVVLTAPVLMESVTSISPRPGNLILQANTAFNPQQYLAAAEVVLTTMLDETTQLSQSVRYAQMLLKGANSASGKERSEGRIAADRIRRREAQLSLTTAQLSMPKEAATGPTSSASMNFSELVDDLTKRRVPGIDINKEPSAVSITCLLQIWKEEIRTLDPLLSRRATTSLSRMVRDDSDGVTATIRMFLPNMGQLWLWLRFTLASGSTRWSARATRINIVSESETIASENERASLVSDSQVVSRFPLYRRTCAVLQDRITCFAADGETMWAQCMALLLRLATLHRLHDSASPSTAATLADAKDVPLERLLRSFQDGEFSYVVPGLLPPEI